MIDRSHWNFFIKMKNSPLHQSQIYKLNAKSYLENNKKQRVTYHLPLTNPYLEKHAPLSCPAQRTQKTRTNCHRFRGEKIQDQRLKTASIYEEEFPMPPISRLEKSWLKEGHDRKQQSLKMERLHRHCMFPILWTQELPHKSYIQKKNGSLFSTNCVIELWTSSQGCCLCKEVS